MFVEGKKEIKDKIKEEDESNVLKFRQLYLDCDRIKSVVDCCRISTTRKLYFNKVLE